MVDNDNEFESKPFYKCLARYLSMDEELSKGTRYYVKTSKGLKSKKIQKQNSFCSDRSNDTDLSTRETSKTHRDILINSPALNTISLYKLYVEEYRCFEVSDYVVIEEVREFSCDVVNDDYVDIYKINNVGIEILHNRVTGAFHLTIYSYDNQPYIIHVSILNRIQSRTFVTKFNETKVFKGITESDLKGMMLNIKLLDWNRVQSNRLIGEVNCSLSNLLEVELDDKCRRNVVFNKCLTLPSYSDKHLGSVLIVLNLDINLQSLRVGIIKARDLKAMDVNNFSDPYCTIKLYISNDKIASRKTSIKYKTLNPVWNESFPLTVTQKHFSENLCLKIKVLDKDSLSSEEIGEITFPSSPNSLEYKHWTAMINNQRSNLSEWHSIKPCH